MEGMGLALSGANEYLMGSLADKFSIYKRFRNFLKAEDRFYGKLLGSSAVGVLAIAMLAGILLFVAVGITNLKR